MVLRLQLALIVFPLGVLAAEPPPVVRQFPLDERTVYEIPIGRDTPTTVMFPSALSAIEAANVSVNPEVPAPVLLAYTAGRYFFSVRALQPDAKAALNIVWKNRTYVLRFFSAPEPCASVTFYEADLNSGPTARRRTSPETLLGLLDRAKSFPLVAAQYPEAAQQIEHASPATTTHYSGFRVSVDDVYRFDPEDTLILRLGFDNESDQEIFYQPQRLAVRVGSNVYYASLADASGILPPKARTSAYVAFTGNARGGRANLSVNNQFSVIVARVDRDVRLIEPR